MKSAPVPAQNQARLDLTGAEATVAVLLRWPEATVAVVQRHHASSSASSSEFLSVYLGWRRSCVSSLSRSTQFASFSANLRCFRDTICYIRKPNPAPPFF